MLERVVATCHSVMSLLASGRSITDPGVKLGIDFLTVGPGANSDWAFWRFAPLLNVEGYENFVAQDLATLGQRIDLGAAPNPDQLLEASALKAYLWSGKKYFRKKSHEYLNRLLRAWNERTCWRNRADTTAHILSLLDEFEFERKQFVFERSIEFLIRSAKRKDGELKWEGRNVPTSYVLMSIAESWLWENQKLRELADQAVDSLLADQRDDHWTAEVPPYGGNEEIRGPEYFTAAVVRGILAVLERKDPSATLQLASLRCQNDELVLANVKSQLAPALRRGEDLRLQLVQANEVIEKLRREGAPAEKITIKWLVQHVSLQDVVIFIGLLFAAFSTGFSAGYGLYPLINRPVVAIESRELKSSAKEAATPGPLIPAKKE